MRSLRCLGLIALLVAVSGGPVTVCADAETPDTASNADSQRKTPRSPKLQELLVNIDRVANRYRDRALRFTCDEIVRYDTAPGFFSTRRPGYADSTNISMRSRQRTYRFRYVYGYDDQGNLENLRTRYRKDGKKVRKKDLEPIEPEDHRIPWELSNAYSWIFVFERPRWHEYDYRWIGESRALGRPAIEIDFEARTPWLLMPDEWVGTAWIDAETFHVLRVEARSTSEEIKRRTFLAHLEHARTSEKPVRSSHSFAQFAISFGEIQHDLRLPTQVEYIGQSVEVFGRGGGADYSESMRFKVQQRYENYRFFGVSSDVAIEKPDPLPESNDQR